MQHHVDIAQAGEQHIGDRLRAGKKRYGGFYRTFTAGQGRHPHLARPPADVDALRLTLARDIGERGKLRNWRHIGTLLTEGGFEFERTTGMPGIEYHRYIGTRTGLRQCNRHHCV